MAYRNPSISGLGTVLTKVALKRSCMVLCSPRWEAHGKIGNWRNLLGILTLTTIPVLTRIYVPLRKKTPIGKPGWGSMLRFPDSAVAQVPWVQLDPISVPNIWEAK